MGLRHYRAGSDHKGLPFGVVDGDAATRDAGYEMAVDGAESKTFPVLLVMDYDLLLDWSG